MGQFDAGASSNTQKEMEMSDSKGSMIGGQPTWGQNIQKEHLDDMKIAVYLWKYVTEYQHRGRLLSGMVCNAWRRNLTWSLRRGR